MKSVQPRARQVGLAIFRPFINRNLVSSYTFVRSWLSFLERFHEIWYRYSVSVPNVTINFWEVSVNVQRHFALHNPPATAMTRRNKRRAIAAQTARSRCKVLSTRYVYYFRAYQKQRTQHGVGVTIKLYFAIFAAFKESLTLNLAQKSFKVIDFGTNRKRVYI